MSEHLVRAAKARHEDTLKRAMAALNALSRAGEPITFAAVARRAGVSTDFLYNTSTLRSRIIQLRGQQSAPDSSGTAPEATASTTTTAIRALSTQLKEQRRRHRQELTELQNALAAAHGENLKLRRQLARVSD